MTEKKAVLNVTVSESVATAVRAIAARGDITISSVVEQALIRELRWEEIRLDGLRAIDEYYREHGYPTEQERAEAAAQVAQEHRLIDEALAAMDAGDRARSRRDADSSGRGGARGSQGVA